MLTTILSIFMIENHETFMPSVLHWWHWLWNLVNANAKGTRWSLKRQELSCQTPTLILYVYYKYECIYTIWNDEIFMPSVWHQRHRHWVDDRLYICIQDFLKRQEMSCWTFTLILYIDYKYLYNWKWWNIFAVSVASMALALGSMVNADRL